MLHVVIRAGEIMKIKKHIYYLHLRTNGSQSNVNKADFSQTCTILRNLNDDANLHHESRHSDMLRLHQMILA